METQGSASHFLINADFSVSDIWNGSQFWKGTDNGAEFAWLLIFLIHWSLQFSQVLLIMHVVDGCCFSPNAKSVLCFNEARMGEEGIPVFSVKITVSLDDGELLLESFCSVGSFILFRPDTLRWNHNQILIDWFKSILGKANTGFSQMIYLFPYPLAACTKSWKWEGCVCPVYAPLFLVKSVPTLELL